ncbi:electron transfer flavoprotein subunit beta/FixA family protein [Streptomyces sp. MBT53]|uniref:electron transfer flavoprotein subunit beta/FixA family protein n=1 Tax=Streptomyces sp. MBT53 TaxID=1488384 RepID=UPI001913401A|nr:electron transfer flavoprotein subunit beta/FixA family protein [Streptomyces sp. MBT53]MBK6012161.1 electron transfer flavoprotein subunit beta/FixA family protein [Streptomyces sp. MBT53]
MKHVPDATADRTFTEDGTTDRASVDSLLSELDEYAVEQALRIAESGPDVEICYLTIGPDDAEDALRKALAMGGDSALHVADEDIEGSDVFATSLVLAGAIRRHGFDLVLCGMASTDGGAGVVPALLAERLGVPAVTHIEELTIEDGTVTGRREGDTATVRVRSDLPAVVSVTDRSGDARYPSFKGIMAAKKKPLETLGLADLGIDAGQVGRTAAWSAVDTATRRPPRTKGELVSDEGTGGIGLAAFLTAKKFA